MSSADIVVGLGWGDETKGATVDWLAHHRRAGATIRFNGGQQAAHNVVVGDVHHTFANFGSGTLAGSRSMVSRFCTVDPLAADAEARALDRMAVGPLPVQVHADAMVTTPLHVLVNRQRETARGESRHGSTGTGFGETIEWDFTGHEPLRARDLDDIAKVVGFLRTYARAKGIENVDAVRMATAMCTASRRSFEVMEEAVWLRAAASHDHLVFEGAQGLMLDEVLGEAPWTTWSNTTAHNARVLCDELGIDDVLTWGCLRTYATRHGAGPLPAEGELASLLGTGSNPDEPHNATTEWAGAFRFAPWTPTVLRRAIQLDRVDRLAVSHLDVADGIVTTKGIVDPSQFGTVGLRAAGPRRSDREPVGPTRTDIVGP